MQQQIIRMSICCNIFQMATIKLFSGKCEDFAVLPTSAETV